MSGTASRERAATAWMVSMVASLADNKAALGRCYADWAVSAPTLESAVAAAAMAQDELGHARSTYPVLNALGMEEGGEGSRGLAPLEQGFPSWPAFIAANLVLDGTLTTFVAACQDSSISQLAQRARKILQEEGSHRVHGEAWARRLRADPGQRAELLRWVAADWREASAWLGTGTEEGEQAALTAGMMRVSTAGQREQMRSFLLGLFRDDGIESELAG